MIFEFKYKKLILLSLIIIIILLNVRFFVPWNRSYVVNDSEKLSGIAFELQQKSAILDYLPATATVAPKEKAYDQPKFLEGNGYVSNFIYKTNRFSFDIDAYTDSVVQIPVMYFPKWIVVSGGTTIPFTISGDYGLVTVNLKQGKHIIEGRFENTAIRIIGNLITLIAFGILLSGYIYRENRKNRRSIS